MKKVHYPTHGIIQYTEQKNVRNAPIAIIYSPRHQTCYHTPILLNIHIKFQIAPQIHQLTKYRNFIIIWNKMIYSGKRNYQQKEGETYEITQCYISQTRKKLNCNHYIHVTLHKSDSLVTIPALILTNV